MTISLISIWNFLSIEYLQLRTPSFATPIGTRNCVETQNSVQRVGRRKKRCVLIRRVCTSLRPSFLCVHMFVHSGLDFEEAVCVHPHQREVALVAIDYF